MTETKRHVLTPEERQRGGRRSGEVRRQRRSRPWYDVLLDDLVAGDPEGTARRVYELTNGAAWIKGLEIATEARKSQLSVRTKEFEERERDLERRERELRRLEPDREAWEEWQALTERESARIEAEVAELVRQRDELRLAIERDAAAHDFELVEEVDGAAVA